MNQTRRNTRDTKCKNDRLTWRFFVQFEIVFVFILVAIALHCIAARQQFVGMESTDGVPMTLGSRNRPKHASVFKAVRQLGANWVPSSHGRTESDGFLRSFRSFGEALF